MFFFGFLYLLVFLLHFENALVQGDRIDQTVWADLEFVRYQETTTDTNSPTDTQGEA